MRRTPAMPLPKPRKDVPRKDVPQIVRAMLTNPDVGDVACREQPNRKYTVMPHPRPGAAGGRASGEEE
jgi:hypothetical protein